MARALAARRAGRLGQASGRRRPGPGVLGPNRGRPPFTLADYRGRPVILFFMAAWCSPCAYEARALARLYAEYGDRGLEVLAVDIDPSEGEADLKRFREWAVPQAGYRWALDPEGALVRAFKVRALDTTVVIDPEGRIVYRDEVSTPYETLKEVVGRLWK